MLFRMRKPAAALAMILAAAPIHAQVLPELPPAQLQTLTQNQAARAAQAQAYVAGQASSLGLTAADSLVARHVLTNPQGECVVRFDQFNQGTRVEGASLVAKVRPDGTVVLKASSLAQGVSLPSSQTQLTPAQALDLLVGKLAPTVGFTQTPYLEPIVYPTRLMGDLVLTKDLATGLLAMDPLRSAELYTPPTAHVRGYRIVCQMQSTEAQPDVTLTVIMDAVTGAILDRTFTGPKVTNPFAYAKGLQPITSKSAPQMKAAKVVKPRAMVATATPGVPDGLLVPTVGWGNAVYSGFVAIPTTFDPALNGYGLLDTTRGSGANAFVQDRLGTNDAYGNYHFDVERPAGNLVLNDQFGMFVPYTMDGLSGSEYPVTAAASGFLTGLPATTGNAAVDDTWGDGGDFLPTTDPTTAYGSFGLEGQASAAEAMNTMTNAYELMKFEFNQLGLDGQDSAMTIIANDGYYPGMVAHQTFGYSRIGATPGVAAPPYGEFGIWAGVGDYANGLASFAEPTYLGRELGEMLWEYTLNGQSGSSISEGKFLDRAFGNLMSQAILSLGALHGIQRNIVGAPWKIGMNWYNGGYETSLFKPSLDGVSPDAWYDGISFLSNDGPDFGDGPLNHAYFYLAEYASADASDITYSPFLPQGMTGLGLEKTIKIVYKALSENILDPASSMHDMRNAAIQAAVDLYGAGGPEVIATTNAFAAANLGGAYGQPDPVMVQFDMHNYPDNSDMGVNGPFEPNVRGSRYPIVPLGESSQLKVNVTGTTDTSLTWTNNPAYFSGTGMLALDGLAQGNITPDGVFTPALQEAGGTINSFSVQARSHADPNQWAQGFVMSLTMDYDGDGSNDALDLGMLALAYNLGAELTNEVNAHIMAGFPGVGEGELQMNLAAFKTAFNK